MGILRLFWFLLGIILLLTGNVVGIILAILIFISCIPHHSRQVDGELTGQEQIPKRVRAKEGPGWKLVDPNSLSVTRSTLADIDAMDGYEFEKHMKRVFENLGYSTHHTPLSGDQGADLIITSNEGIRTAVQLKRYSGKVSNGAVQEVVASKAFHKCTKGMVITNSSFTDSAIQLARANDVNLVDRTGLTRLLNESFSLMNEKQEQTLPVLPEQHLQRL